MWGSTQSVPAPGTQWHTARTDSKARGMVAPVTETSADGTVYAHGRWTYLGRPPKKS